MAPKKLYSQQQMTDAIHDVKRGMPLASAAKKHAVPRITLRNKIVGKSPEVCGMGPKTVLTSEEENILEDWILAMVKRQYPITKYELQDSVAQILRELEKKGEKRENTFTDGRPGRKWFESFLRRHPAISERVPQNITTARSDVSESQIELWFKEVKSYLDLQNLADVIKDPSRVFNSDESAFFLMPKGTKVLAKKGDKVVYNRGSSDEKENLTVLVTANAKGQLAPPMIVYKYERIPSRIANSVPKGWGIGRSDSGWMCAETFFEYITNVFYPWLKSSNIQLPIIFFMDGHVSHLSLHLSQFCSSNGIELICLYANSTHILQPLDVSVFRPLKQFWKQEIRKWRMENSGKFQKEDFAPVLKEALDHLSEETFLHGFKACGLCPFKFNNINFNKLRICSDKPVPKEIMLQNNNNQALIILEKEIAEEKLALFKNTLNDINNIWDGAVEDTSLFNLWKKLKIRTVRTEHLQIPERERETDKSSQETQIGTQISLQNFSQDDQNEVLERMELSHHSFASISPLCKSTPRQSSHPIELYSVETNDVPNNDRMLAMKSHPAKASTSEQLPKPCCSYTSSLDNTINFMSKPELNLQKSPEQLSLLPLSRCDNTAKQVVPESLNEISDPKEIVLATSNVTTPTIKQTKNIQSVVPSPFKRVLFWPEEKTTGIKRRKKEKIPAVVTSEQWRKYNENKKKEKERIELEKKERIRLREIKKIENERKKQDKLNKKKKTSNKKKKICSSSESDCSNFTVHDSDDQWSESFSDFEAVGNQYKEYDFVIVKYEGEYYPGEIKKINDGKKGTEYQVLTMIMCGVKQWRWPATSEEKRSELCWYNEESVLKKIKKPSTRGDDVYEVKEINEYQSV